MVLAVTDGAMSFPTLGSPTELMADTDGENDHQNMGTLVVYNSRRRMTTRWRGHDQGVTSTADGGSSADYDTATAWPTRLDRDDQTTPR